MKQRNVMPTNPALSAPIALKHLNGLTQPWTVNGW